MNMTDTRKHPATHPMTLAVCTAGSASLERLSGLASRHAQLGAFFDCGTFATVIDCRPGAAGADALARDLAPPLGAGFSVLADLGALAGGRPVHGPPACFVTGAWDADDPSVDLEPLHRLLGEGAAISFLVHDAREEMPPLWILSSLALPCLGPVPACSRAEVLATWLAVLGRESGDARDLLTGASAHDAAGERDLSARLKQLYGSDH